MTLHIGVQHPRKDMCLDANLFPVANGMLVNPGNRSSFFSDDVLRKRKVAKRSGLPLPRTQHPLQKIRECASFGAIRTHRRHNDPCKGTDGVDAGSGSVRDRNFENLGIFRKFSKVPTIRVDRENPHKDGGE